MPISSRPVSRRATLAAAPVLLVAGCRWGPDEETPAAPEKAAAEAVPDADQVDTAATAIAQVHGFVELVSGQHTELAEPLTALSAMHVAHLDLLSQEGDQYTTLNSLGKLGPAAALREVRRRELHLQRKLTVLAGQVSSGPLARTLAAMAAGVAQHRQVLPASRKGSDA